MKGKVVKLGTAKDLKDSISGETLVMELSGIPAADDLEKIKKMKFVKGLAAEKGRLNAFVGNAEEDAPKMISTLEKMGFNVEKISMKKPTLDDVFLKYVGTKLDTRGTASEARSARKMIIGG